MTGLPDLTVGRHEIGQVTLLRAATAGPITSMAIARPPLAERVRDVARSLGCTVAWTRAAGPHVLLGLGTDDAFARVTPLGGQAYGLSLRSRVAKNSDDDAPEISACPQAWEPMLLVDTLADVVQHALIAEAAFLPRAAGM